MRAGEMALMIPIVAVVCPFIVLALHVILGAFSKTICHWRDVSLKIKLVEAGMSPPEVEQVLLAGRKHAKKKLSRDCGDTPMAGKGFSSKPPVKMPV